MQPDLERELIRKCRTGDARFYEPLVRAYEPSGLRLAVAMLGNMEDAHDALQDAFVKAYEALHRFDLRRPFGPWFFQILRNHCRDMLRSRQARFKVEALDEQARAAARRTRKAARSASGSAPRRGSSCGVRWRRSGEEHREILVLKELQGFRYDEIAKILDIPEGTVASRLFHARRALKDALEAMGAEFP